MDIVVTHMINSPFWIAVAVCLVMAIIAQLGSSSRTLPVTVERYDQWVEAGQAAADEVVVSEDDNMVRLLRRGDSVIIRC